MKSVFAITRCTAASTSAAMLACCAFRSTRGSLLFSPGIRPLEITLEAHELVDVLHLDRRVPGDHDAGCDVLRHDAARPDQRARADAQARKDGRVGADAH